jgi:hypothetical protein
MYWGIKGFSPQNIWRMKQFFETYNGNEKLSTLLREIDEILERMMIFWREKFSQRTHIVIPALCRNPKRWKRDHREKRMLTID